MNVLVIGQGGREHALAWKIAQDQSVRKVFVAPGNAGTATESKVTNIAIDSLDIDGLVKFAQKNAVTLTIVGPEAPLVAGIVDTFESKKLLIFGPSKQAAQLEGSKAYAKKFLERYQIPTANYRCFENITEAKTYIRQQGTPVVIKADGLAAGKGVIVAETEDQAFVAAETMLAGNALGSAGHRIVVEEFLEGEEASFIAMVDGEHLIPLATSQDHKARDNGDKGPNTGGMGAYSPAPVITSEIYQKVMQDIMLPTLEGLRQEGIKYKGFLYLGLMIDKSGNPRVLEYNCRLGDPEAQVILMRLESSLLELALAGASGRIHLESPIWSSSSALGVVIAAQGYPGAYQKNQPIEQLDKIKLAKTFHSGTKERQGLCVSNGGRVLCITALGSSVQEARTKAYQSVKLIKWSDGFYRTDIGYRALS